jgi:hypothetical protein
MNTRCPADLTRQIICVSANAEATGDSDSVTIQRKKKRKFMMGSGD